MNSNSPKKGIVYLVGAGPGHPGLITRWGYELLHKCDAVAYDALIPMELISGLPETVERYYVGKRARRHSVPQPQINELLVTLAERGLNVVRLKGGDPFVFGRIGEEAKYLSDAGVPVVMVPGVTAASAAAAMGGFSLTSRQESSWVFIATGHPAEDSSTPVPWEKVASLAGGTLVIYMGIARIEGIVQQLLESGMPPETPSVVVQAASTGLQKSVQAPLNEICAESRRQGLKPPALVIIGEPVRCQTDNYGIRNFFLAGKRVLLTGAPLETGETATALRSAGAEPIPYPTVRNRPFNDDEGWKRFRGARGTGASCLLRKSMDVGYFFDALGAHGMDARSLAGVRMIALGTSTAGAMRSRGILADATIDDASPESVAKGIPSSTAAPRPPLLYPRSTGEKSPPDGSYGNICGEIISLVVRDEAPAEWDTRWKDELVAAPPDFIIFGGESEITAFLDILGKDSALELASRSRIVATDRSAAEMLRRLELPGTLILRDSGDEKLVEALANLSKP